MPAPDGPAEAGCDGAAEGSCDEAAEGADDAAGLHATTSTPRTTVIRNRSRRAPAMVPRVYRPWQGPSGTLSLLRESVSANCSVTLSVSSDEGDDHDDERTNSGGRWVLTKVMVGELTVDEAANCSAVGAVGLAPARRRFRRRARPGWSTATVDEPRHDGSTRRPGSGSASSPGPLDGANDSHLAELLAEPRGSSISRVSVRRHPPRRPASPARAVAGRHATAAAATGCPRRACCSRPTASRHDWLGERGPR